MNAILPAKAELASFLYVSKYDGSNQLPALVLLLYRVPLLTKEMAQCCAASQYTPYLDNLQKLRVSHGYHFERAVCQLSHTYLVEIMH